MGVPVKSAFALLLTNADRVGHESIDITYRYAHLFPTRQAEMADKLNMERKGA